jgi:Terminase large subunit, T4likevirus-type, N-terminal
MSIGELNKADAETLRMLARSIDPIEFCRQFFEPDFWQKDLLLSTENQAILNCSRMAGKSEITSIIALFHAINNPQSLILCVSPSLRQSGELLKKITNHYHELGKPLGATIDSATTLQLSNRSRIVSLPASEKTVRGYSADLICVDEASRCPEELFIAIRPMRALGGRLILLSSPAGKRGTFHREWTEGEGWKKIEVKATDVPRISSTFLDSERRSLGERWYQQEYMCSFTESEAALLSYDIIQRAVRDDVEELNINYGDDEEAPLSYREDADQINELDLDFGDDSEDEEQDVPSTGQVEREDLAKQEAALNRGER